MSHAEQDKECFYLNNLTLGSASRYSQNQSQRKKLKNARKRERFSMYHSFCIPLCQIPKVQNKPKMKIDVILKLYMDMLFFIRKQTSWNILVVVVVKR